VPQFVGDNFWLILLPGVLWGALLAGYVPLSALVPSLVKKDKGAAMAILNLGAGLPVFVGPAIVGLFIGLIGNAGVIWILAILYFISALLTKFITLPEPPRDTLPDTPRDTLPDTQRDTLPDAVQNTTKTIQ
jgi:MFS family permease